MAEYQEARKEKTEKLKGRLEETREEAISRQDLPDGTPCPSCGAANPPEAEFCCECGFPLRQAAFCPSCGAKTNPGADICPVCGTWLLDGKCTFCYAEIPPDAEFCPECGNPRGGVSCPSCGTLSIFDFCKKCGTPLTEGAQAALEEAKSDPDAQAVLAAVREAGAIEAQLAELEEKLRELPPEAGPDEAPAPPQKRKAFFSAAQLAAIHGSKHLVDAAEQHKQEEEENQAKREEEQKRRAEADRAAKLKAEKAALEKKMLEAAQAAEEAMHKYKNKKFLSPQEARRFHMARRPGGTSGWLCNFTNTVHQDGPNGCDEPQHGGEWYFGETVVVNVTGPS